MLTDFNHPYNNQHSYRQTPISNNIIMAKSTSLGIFCITWYVHHNYEAVSLSKDE